MLSHNVTWKYLKQKCNEFTFGTELLVFYQLFNHCRTFETSADYSFSYLPLIESFQYYQLFNHCRTFETSADYSFSYLPLIESFQYTLDFYLRQCWEKRWICVLIWMMYNMNAVLSFRLDIHYFSRIYLLNNLNVTKELRCGL